MYILSATDIMPNASLPTVNLTARAEYGFCPNICPFNAEDPDNFDVMHNPCQYTVEVMEVFKPLNYTGVSRQYLLPFLFQQ